MELGTITSTIATIVDTLNVYISENQQRTVGKNEKRVVLFQRLIREITNTFNQISDTNTPIVNHGYLQCINQLILDAIKANQALDNHKEHVGKSTTTLFKVFEIMNQLLTASNNAIIASHSPAPVIAAITQTDTVDTPALETTHSTLASQTETFSAEASPTQENFLSYILSLNPLKFEVDTLSAKGDEWVRDKSPLSDLQQQFYQDLVAECDIRHLHISNETLHLMTQSPLLNRYEKHLTCPNPENNQGLRYFIQCIGEIIALCMHSGNALNDLHSLVLLTNEKALLQLIECMISKNLIACEEKDVEPTSEPLLLEIKAFLKSTLLNPDNAIELTSSEIDALQKAAEKTAPTDDQPPDIHTVQTSLARSQQQLLDALKISLTLDIFADKLIINNLSLIKQTHFTHIDQGHESIQRLSLQIKCQYEYLIELTHKLKRQQEQIQHHHNQLKEAFLQLQNTVVSQDNAELHQALQLFLLDYQHYSKEFNRLDSQFTDAINGVTSTCEDARTLIQASEKLERVSTQLEEATELKKQLRQDMHQVINAIQTHHQDSEAIAQYPGTDDSQYEPPLFSLAFLCKLANKPRIESDCFATVELMQLLHQQNALTKPLKTLLVFNNHVHCLLSLHRFLNQHQVNINGSQTALLWSLIESHIDFSLLNPLIERWHLSSEMILTTLLSLIPTWHTSVSLLNQIFEAKSPFNPAVFEQVLTQAKHHPLFIVHLHKVICALKQFQPAFLADCFSEKNLTLLIRLMLLGEFSTLNQLIFLLKACHEQHWVFADFEKILQFMSECNEKNLLVSHLMQEWKALISRQPLSFLDYCHIIFASTPAAEFKGAMQSNLTMQSTPLVRAQSCRFQVPVIFDVRTEQTVLTELPAETRFFLTIIEKALKHKGRIFLDDATDPSFIGWMPVDEDAIFMDGYVYMTVSTINTQIQELRSLIQEAQALEATLAEKGVVDQCLSTSGYLNLGTDNRKLTKLSEDKDGAIKKIVKQFESKMNQIVQKKLEIDSVATTTISQAFGYERSMPLTAGLFSGTQRYRSDEFSPIHTASTGISDR